jgi:hypothetical protein
VQTLAVEAGDRVRRDLQVRVPRMLVVHQEEVLMDRVDRPEQLAIERDNQRTFRIAQVLYFMVWSFQCEVSSANGNTRAGSDAR